MTDQTSTQSSVTDDIVLADGVDDEPAERNRRLFEGTTGLILAALATIYAAFHMLALNGVSLSAITGVDLPF